MDLKVGNWFGFKEKRIWTKLGFWRNFLEVVKGRDEAQSLINEWSREMREKAWGKTLVGLEKKGDER